jgi:glutamine cyclotransferase
METKHWSRPALCLILCAFAPAASVNSPPLTYGYEIVHVYPHDRNAFTQGLIYLLSLAN